MIFKAIKIGICVGIGTWSAMTAFIVVECVTSGFTKGLIASLKKEKAAASQEKVKTTAGKGGNFTYVDEQEED